MTNPLREALNASMTEQELQDVIVAYAKTQGWMVAHHRPARTKDGWVTAVAYDGKGFPDLVLARHGRVVFIELKTDRGRVSKHQQRWIDTLPDAHIIRPSDWHTLQEVLR